jgi:hypothetical protein
MYCSDYNVTYLFSVGTISRDSLTLPPAVLPATSGGKDDDLLPETSSLTSQSSHNLSTDSAVAPAQKYSSNNIEETSKISQLAQKDESHSSRVTVPLQEPDVIASTKNTNTANNISGMNFDGGVESSVPVPVAPPRRKKKSKPQTPRTLTVSNVVNIISFVSFTLNMLLRSLTLQLTVQLHSFSIVTLPSITCINTEHTVYMLYFFPSHHLQKKDIHSHHLFQAQPAQSSH